MPLDGAFWTAIHRRERLLLGQAAPFLNPKVKGAPKDASRAARVLPCRAGEREAAEQRAGPCDGASSLFQAQLALSLHQWGPLP